MPGTTVKLGFIGFCKADIMLYLARILFCAGETVGIVDQSGSQELSLSVPAGLYAEDRLDYRGVELFLNCESTGIQDLSTDHCSVLLIDYGVNRKAIEQLEGLKALFIVTDMQRHHAVPLSAVISHLPFQPDAIRILRDIVPGKIRPRYLDSLLQAAQFTNLLAKYDLPFVPAEYAQRLICQYDDVFRFTRINEGFESMLSECVTELFGYDRKVMLKALRKAQRGG